MGHRPYALLWSCKILYGNLINHWKYYDILRNIVARASYLVSLCIIWFWMVMMCCYWLWIVTRVNYSISWSWMVMRVD
jgi:hypothetical protein